MTAPLELAGFTVGITADRRWTEQAALFERRGAKVLHAPAIKTLPLGAEAPLRRATDEVVANPPAILIASTGVGIRSWFADAQARGVGQGLAAALARARIYARGPKAAGAVHAAGLEVVARARTERMSEVVEMVTGDLRPGERVAVQLDGSGGSAHVEQLRQAGAEVLAVPVYRWTAPDDPGPAQRLAEAVLSGRVQAVTFTAAPAVGNWMAIARQSGTEGELRRALTDGRAVLGCVGPTCVEAAGAEGLESPHLVQPDIYRLGPLVRAVTQRLVARRVTVRLGEALMTIGGNAVFVDGKCLSLTGTEARLLATLASKPNSVHTKEELLGAVWAGSSTDPHTVEVGIARLRRRLGPHGLALRSVRRRGYTLRA